MAWKVLVTDTFGGEANYCWANKTWLADRPHKDWPQTRRYLVRNAKAFAGWTGMRCRIDNFDDGLEIRPQGLAQICFVTWWEPTEHES